MENTGKSLPPETTDKIIDFLHDHPAALAASALVDSSWRHRAQWLLFARVFLRDRKAYDTLRHLEIIDDQNRPYGHQIPLTLCLAFPALQSIAYHNAQWHEKTRLHPAFFPSLSIFSRVAALELHTCQFRSFRDFARFISALQGLRDLTLVRTHVGQQPLNVALSPHNSKLEMPRLRYLRAEHLLSEDGSLAALLTWLARTPSGQTVQVLQIIPQAMMLQTSFHAPVDDLLGPLGSCVTDLDIPVFLHDIRPEPHPGLSSNSQLRTLVLRYTFREHWQIAWASIEQMLRSIASLYLRSLELVFTIFRATGPAGGGTMDLTDSNVDWGPINNVISTKHFGALEKASVTLDWHVMDTIPPGDVERFRDMIDKGLKQLDWHRRGLLTVTHHNHSWSPPSAPEPGRAQQ